MQHMAQTLFIMHCMYENNKSQLCFKATTTFPNDRSANYKPRIDKERAATRQARTRTRAASTPDTLHFLASFRIALLHQPRLT